MADGTVLVVEIGRKTVDRVHPDGTVEVIAEPGGGPNGLAIGPDGAVYVCNSGGFGMHDMGGLTVTDLHAAGRLLGRTDRARRSGHRRVQRAVRRVRRTLVDRAQRSGVRRHRWLLVHRPWEMAATPSARTEGCTTRVPTARRSARWRTRSSRRTAWGSHPTDGGCTSRRRLPPRVHAWDLTGPGEIDTSGPFGAHGVAVCGLPGYQFLDSLGVDSAGNVVVGTLVNGGLTVIAPSGEILEHVALPDPIVTNVCFGGDERRTRSSRAAAPASWCRSSGRDPAWSSRSTRDDPAFAPCRLYRRPTQPVHQGAARPTDLGATWDL